MQLIGVMNVKYKLLYVILFILIVGISWICMLKHLQLGFIYFRIAKHDRSQMQLSTKLSVRHSFGELKPRL